MDRSKISWGLALLSAGVIWLLDNLGVIDFSWMSVFRFWPLIIILVGINIMLPKNEKGNYAYGFFMVICLAFFIYQGVTGTYSPFTWNKSSNGDTVETAKSNSDEKIDAAWSDEIKYAKLKIEAGAVSYRLASGNNALINVDMPKNSPRHSLQTVVKGEQATLSLATKSSGGGGSSKRVGIMLHQQPVWDIQLEMGAGSANFDLSNLKVAKMSVEEGASSVQLKFGKPYQNSKVSIESGASSTKILLPKGTSCRIKMESAISSNKLRNFKKIRDGVYESEGFDENGSFYTIDYEGGLSSFSVNWY
ncbi:LiaI-LiaF-like domain-containing protein [Olivibacter sitiensis]|uniref:LiaI-LiaF-like domain-containing protein n=1 Tax=Olivibacter sitiensis TaxID=376470 RepID=UPI00041A4385|nr:DUF5668 domain-containing protein [Olivibacter sitiensis]